jgi:glucan endo-1,3-alpha-glucosidase
MPCAGAASEQCGNAYRSSLYTYLPNVESMGCYKDSGSPRTLPAYSVSLASMTPLLCQSTCLNKGYTFAGKNACVAKIDLDSAKSFHKSGTSYGRECYCSSTTPASTLKTTDSDCNMPCAGDSSQICGQAYRLNVYSLGDSSTAPTTSASATKSSTSTTSTPTTAKTTSTTSAAATETATALGCYIDSGTARTLPDASSSSSSMTPTLCQSTCRTQGYIYAGK